MNLFITAALGSQDFLGAAKRLERQALSTSLFSRTVIVTESDLHGICPELFNWYSNQELNNLPGFGYYAWKSAIAAAATSGYWGNYSSITFLDAGCEIVPGSRNRAIFSDLIEQSKLKGAVVFSTGCPEWQYTKPYVWSHFKEISGAYTSDQIMSGIWILSGELGAKISETWNSYASLSPEMTNDAFEYAPLGFVAPRHDQSIFSLVVKSFGIGPQIAKPPFPRSSSLSKLFSLRFPIWAARNRGALSTITLPYKVIANLLPRKFW